MDSASKSHTVFPSAVFPNRSVAPALKSMASAKEVLPESEWPAKATLRILPARYCFISKVSPFYMPVLPAAAAKEPPVYLKINLFANG